MILKRVKNKKAKRRVNYRKILIFFLVFYLIIQGLIVLVKLPIKNIYIHNNIFFSDQKIIEIAKIDDYPSTVNNFSFMIKKRLIKNDYIIDALVYKKNFTEVHIEVTENYPLFFDNNKEKVIFYNNFEATKFISCPTLINYVPDTIYNLFKSEMKKIEIDVLKRISDIEYDPNDIDTNRFLFYMSDGNHVYLTLNKFKNINDYLSIMENIIAKFGNKKGTLYLDAGGYFELFE